MGKGEQEVNMLNEEADIDCTFLTELLRFKGFLDEDNRVTSFNKVYHNSEGSNSFTIRLCYLKEMQNAPASLFVKSDKIRGGEIYKKLCRNEIEFYKLARHYDINRFIL